MFVDPNIFADPESGFQIDLCPVLQIRIRMCFGPLGSGSVSISQRHASGSVYHQTKIVRKTLIPTVL
jgi:hypothetical protein